MSIEERIAPMVPFEYNETVDLEGHPAWFVDTAHEQPDKADYMMSTIAEAVTQGMMWGAEHLPLPRSKGSEWRTLNFVRVLISPTVVTNQSEVAEREARLSENLVNIIGDFDKHWSEYKAELLALYKPYKEFDLEKATSLEIVRKLPNLKMILKRMCEIHFQCMYESFYIFMLFDDFCRETLGIGSAHPDFQAMISGFDNRSFQCERELWKLSKDELQLGLGEYFEYPSSEILTRLKDHPNGPKWIKAFREFLDEFGWRCEMFWKASAPSWREDPKPAIDKIKIYQKLKEADALRERLKKVSDKREGKIAEYMAKVPDDSKEMFNLLLRGAQYSSIYSEEHDLYCEMQTDALMHVYTSALGKRFVEAGTINEIDDIHLLTYGEMCMIGMNPQTYRLHSLVTSRMEKGKKDAKEVIPNVYSKTMGEQEAFGWMMSAREPITATVIVGELPQPKPDLKADFIGVGGASGVAEGPAHVIKSVAEMATIQPGEILIAETTSITWTPLFSLVAGAVLDRGGTLSHAAVVCREYGIPCVLNTFQATAKIKNGQRIRVDGDNGVVYILD